MTVDVHRVLATARWNELSLIEQVANIGSEVGRALRARNAGNESRAGAALDRALELFDLTLADERWRGRRREIARSREFVVRAFFGGEGVNTASLDRYFLEFATASHREPATAVQARNHISEVPQIDLADRPC